MTDDRALDEAIVLATERTRAAQDDVAEVIEADAAPPPALVDEVEKRAEDLEELTREAAE